MQKLNELKLDRNLLDRNFEGYKLSLSPIPVYSQDVNADGLSAPGVDEIQPSDDQFSFLHQRLFGLHNHLASDPWNGSAVYFVDVDRKVRRSWIGEHGRLEQTVEVMELSPIEEASPGRYNASMRFPSQDTCLLCDGAGTLYFVDTSNRSSGDVVQWKILYQGQPLGKHAGFSICDAQTASDNLTKVLNCVVEHVAPSTSATTRPNKKTPGYETVLTWLTISEEINGDWIVRAEELRGSGPAEYVALEAGSKGAFVVSEAVFRSPKVANARSKLNESSSESVECDFEWQQTFEDIKVRFPLTEDQVEKSEVKVESKASQLSIYYKDKLLLTGELYGAVDSSLTSWTASNDLLEVSLQKYHEGTMWPEFIKCEQRGKEVPDPGVVEQVNANLAHLTSDKEEAAGQVLSAMEECDANDEESRTLMRFDSESLDCTNKVHLGSQQWLLVVGREADKVPAFCVRNDVDGCVWLPGKADTVTGEWPVDHVGTLLAFGYVQASKTKRKFSIAPPDLSYVAIVDVSGHVIVYRKGVAVDTSLRNRKTGRESKEIAVQQLVNLHSPSPILGAVAADQYIFILSKKALHLLHIVG